MSDLISRNYAIYELRDLITEPDISDDEIKIEGYNEGIKTAISLLSVLSSAMPEERKTKIHDDKVHPVIHYCGNNIVTLINPTWSYCPSCGAKLEWK